MLRRIGLPRRALPRRSQFVGEVQPFARESCRESLLGVAQFVRQLLRLAFRLVAECIQHPLQTFRNLLLPVERAVPLDFRADSVVPFAAFQDRYFACRASAMASLDGAQPMRRPAPPAAGQVVRALVRFFRIVPPATLARQQLCSSSPSEHALVRSRSAAAFRGQSARVTFFHAPADLAAARLVVGQICGRPIFRKTPQSAAPALQSPRPEQLPHW